MVDVIERVFEVHGAVPMDSTDVGFCPIDAPADIAAMLSTSGARLAMRPVFPALVSLVVPGLVCLGCKPRLEE